MEHDDERSLSLGTEVSASVPPPSPLTGCYLLAVIGEPHTHEHKEIILQRLVKGLLSWDSGEHQVDLEKELATLAAQAPEGEEARYGERLIQFASENLVTEILIHPQMNTLMQCMRNLLSSFTRHRHLVHAGYTFAGNGSWIMQDGTFSLADFTDAYQENEVQRVIRAYENSISIDIHCSTSGGGEWAKLPEMPFVKHCKIRVNPTDILDSGSQAIKDFTSYLEPYIVPASLDQLLVSSDVVGNIRFSHPTLYVFPGGQGDAALFGINGFNMLVDGGFSRKACWWDFARHLDRLDAVLFTRLNNCSVSGMAAVLRRKAAAPVYPHIGHFFCNLEERRVLASPDGDKDADPLSVSLVQEGADMMTDLRHINLKPQHCYRSPEPVNLYHKVGHGTLDMYVLNPSKDSKYVREFLKKWHNSEQKLFEGANVSGQFNFPMPNLVSICALLVWRPANPDDTITRIMFPGSTPQHKIFEGLERLKHLDFLQTPTCTGRQITATTPPAAPTTTVISTKSTKHATSKVSKERSIVPEKTKEDKIVEPEPPPHKFSTIKHETDSKNIIDNKLLSELVDGEEKKIESVLQEAMHTKIESKLNDKIAQYESSVIDGLPKKKDIKKKDKIVEKKSKRMEKTDEGKDSLVKTTEMKKSDSDNKAKTETKKKTEIRTKTENMASTMTRTKLSHRATQKGTEKKITGGIIDKKISSDDKKSPPTTPKKVLDTKVMSSNGQSNKPKIKMRKLSPGSTPAATKETTNRRVVESKYKQVSPKRDLTQKVSDKKDIKPKREPISRRPRPLASPVKGLKAMKSPTKSVKSVKTDSKLRGLQKVNYEDILKEAKKSDEDTSKSLDDIKQQELDDKEEQEIVREIEAVFNRDSEAEEKLEYIGRSDIEKITCLLDDAKTETTADGEFEEEYLIIEKEEVDQFTEDSIADRESSHEQEDELQKHLKDKQESEKKRDDLPAHEIEKTEEGKPKADDAIETDKQTESKEHSVSVEEKQDISSEKRTSDSKNGAPKPKDSLELNIVPESQPDEKISTTIESGATTAPTLPEDERITLDDIKEDQQVEEKHIREDTKEIIPSQTLIDIQKPTSLEKIMKLETKPAPIREIVKTPDEVADLPLHEEVDYRTYEEKKAPTEEDVFKRKPDVGFVHEIKVPKDLPLPGPETAVSYKGMKTIQGDVIIKTVQCPSHPEVVTVTPGSAPESPMYHEQMKITLTPGKDLEPVKEYDGSEFDYGQFTEKLRETHITTLDSPIKNDIVIIEEVPCMPEKIPSIPEDVEKEIEEARKLEIIEKPPLSPIDVEKIVADVAEVLKSEKSLEEIMAEKSPTIRKSPEIFSKLEMSSTSAIETSKTFISSEKKTRQYDKESKEKPFEGKHEHNVTEALPKEVSPVRSMTSEDVSETSDKTVLSEGKRAKREIKEDKVSIVTESMPSQINDPTLVSVQAEAHTSVDTDFVRKGLDRLEHETEVQIEKHICEKPEIAEKLEDSLESDKRAVASMLSQLDEKVATLDVDTGDGKITERKLSITLDTAKTLEKLEEKMADLKKKEEAFSQKLLHDKKPTESFEKRELSPEIDALYSKQYSSQSKVLTSDANKTNVKDRKSPPSPVEPDVKGTISVQLDEQVSDKKVLSPEKERRASSAMISTKIPDETTPYPTELKEQLSPKEVEKKPADKDFSPEEPTRKIPSTMKPEEKVLSPVEPTQNEKVDNVSSPLEAVDNLLSPMKVGDKVQAILDDEAPLSVEKIEKSPIHVKSDEIVFVTVPSSKETMEKPNNVTFTMKLDVKAHSPTELIEKAPSPEKLDEKVPDNKVPPPLKTVEKVPIPEKSDKEVQDDKISISEDLSKKPTSQVNADGKFSSSLEPVDKTPSPVKSDINVLDEKIYLPVVPVKKPTSPVKPDLKTTFSVESSEKMPGAEKPHEVVSDEKVPLQEELIGKPTSPVNVDRKVSPSFTHTDKTPSPVKSDVKVIDEKVPPPTKPVEEPSPVKLDVKTLSPAGLTETAVILDDKIPDDKVPSPTESVEKVKNLEKPDDDGLDKKVPLQEDLEQKTPSQAKSVEKLTSQVKSDDKTPSLVGLIEKVSTPVKLDEKIPDDKVSSPTDLADKVQSPEKPDEDEKLPFQEEVVEKSSILCSKVSPPFTPTDKTPSPVKSDVKEIDEKVSPPAKPVEKLSPVKPDIKPPSPAGLTEKAVILDNKIPVEKVPTPTESPEKVQSPEKPDEEGLDKKVPLQEDFVEKSVKLESKVSSPLTPTDKTPSPVKSDVKELDENVQSQAESVEKPSSPVKLDDKTPSPAGVTEKAVILDDKIPVEKVPPSTESPEKVQSPEKPTEENLADNIPLREDLVEKSKSPENLDSKVSPPFSPTDKTPSPVKSDVKVIDEKVSPPAKPVEKLSPVKPDGKTISPEGHIEKEVILDDKISDEKVPTPTESAEKVQSPEKPDEEGFDKKVPLQEDLVEKPIKLGSKVSSPLTPTDKTPSPVKSDVKELDKNVPPQAESKEKPTSPVKPNDKTPSPAGLIEKAVILHDKIPVEIVPTSIESPEKVPSLEKPDKERFDEMVPLQEDLVEKSKSPENLDSKVSPPFTPTDKTPSPVKSDIKVLDIKTPSQAESMQKLTSTVKLDDKASSPAALIEKVSISLKLDEKIPDDEVSSPVESSVKVPSPEKSDDKLLDEKIPLQKDLIEKPTSPVNLDSEVSPPIKPTDKMPSPVKADINVFNEKVSSPAETVEKPTSPMQLHVKAPSLTELLEKSPSPVKRDGKILEDKVLSPIDTAKKVSSPDMSTKEVLDEGVPLQEDSVEKPKSSVNLDSKISPPLKPTDKMPSPVKLDMKVLHEKVSSPAEAEEKSTSPLQLHVKVPSPAELIEKTSSPLKVAEKIPDDKDPSPVESAEKVSSPDMQAKEVLDDNIPLQETVVEKPTSPVDLDGKVSPPLKPTDRTPSPDMKVIVETVPSPAEPDINTPSLTGLIEKAPTLVKLDEKIPEDKVTSPIESAEIVPMLNKEVLDNKIPMPEDLPEKPTSLVNVDGKPLEIKAPSPAEAPSPMKSEEKVIVEKVPSLQERLEKQTSPLDVKPLSQSDSVIKTPSPVKSDVNVPEEKVPSMIEAVEKPTSPLKLDGKTPSPAKVTDGPPITVKVDEIVPDDQILSKTEPVEKDQSPVKSAEMELNKKVPSPVDTLEKPTSPLKLDVKASSIIESVVGELSPVKSDEKVLDTKDSLPEQSEETPTSPVKQDVKVPSPAESVKSDVKISSEVIPSKEESVQKLKSPIKLDVKVHSLMEPIEKESSPVESDENQLMKDFDSSAETVGKITSSVTKDDISSVEQVTGVSGPGKLDDKVPTMKLDDNASTLVEIIETASMQDKLFAEKKDSHHKILPAIESVAKVPSPVKSDELSVRTPVDDRSLSPVEPVKEVSSPMKLGENITDEKFTSSVEPVIDTPSPLHKDEKEKYDNSPSSVESVKIVLSPMKSDEEKIDDNDSLVKPFKEALSLVELDVKEHDEKTDTPPKQIETVSSTLKLADKVLNDTSLSVVEPLKEALSTVKLDVKEQEIDDSSPFSVEQVKGTLSPIKLGKMALDDQSLSPLTPVEKAPSTLKEDDKQFGEKVKTMTDALSSIKQDEKELDDKSPSSEESVKEAPSPIKIDNNEPDDKSPIVEPLQETPSTLNLDVKEHDKKSASPLELTNKDPITLKLKEKELDDMKPSLVEAVKEVPSTIKLAKKELEKSPSPAKSVDNAPGTMTEDKQEPDHKYPSSVKSCKETLSPMTLDEEKPDDKSPYIEPVKEEPDTINLNENDTDDMNPSDVEPVKEIFSPMKLDVKEQDKETTSSPNQFEKVPSTFKLAEKVLDDTSLLESDKGTPSLTTLDNKTTVEKVTSPIQVEERILDDKVSVPLHIEEIPIDGTSSAVKRAETAQSPIQLAEKTPDEELSSSINLKEIVPQEKVPSPTTLEKEIPSEETPSPIKTLDKEQSPRQPDRKILDVKQTEKALSPIHLNGSLSDDKSPSPLHQDGISDYEVPSKDSKSFSAVQVDVIRSEEKQSLMQPEKKIFSEKSPSTEKFDDYLPEKKSLSPVKQIERKLDSGETDDKIQDDKSPSQIELSEKSSSLRQINDLSAIKKSNTDLNQEITIFTTVATEQIEDLPSPDLVHDIEINKEPISILNTELVNEKDMNDEVKISDKAEVVTHKELKSVLPIKSVTEVEATTSEKEKDCENTIIPGDDIIDGVMLRKIEPSTSFKTDLGKQLDENLDSTKNMASKLSFDITRKSSIEKETLLSQLDEKRKGLETEIDSVIDDSVHEAKVISDTLDENQVCLVKDVQQIKKIGESIIEMQDKQLDSDVDNIDSKKEKVKSEIKHEQVEETDEVRDMLKKSAFDDKQESNIEHIKDNVPKLKAPPKDTETNLIDKSDTIVMTPKSTISLDESKSPEKEAEDKLIKSDSSPETEIESISDKSNVGTPGFEIQDGKIVSSLKMGENKSEDKAPTLGEPGNKAKQDTEVEEVSISMKLDENNTMTSLIDDKELVLTKPEEKDTDVKISPTKSAENIPKEKFQSTSPITFDAKVSDTKILPPLTLDEMVLKDEAASPKQKITKDASSELFNSGLAMPIEETVIPVYVDKNAASYLLNKEISVSGKDEMLSTVELSEDKTKTPVSTEEKSGTETPRSAKLHDTIETSKQIEETKSEAEEGQLSLDLAAMLEKPDEKVHTPEKVDEPPFETVKKLGAKAFHLEHPDEHLRDSVKPDQKTLDKLNGKASGPKLLDKKLTTEQLSQKLPSLKVPHEEAPEISEEKASTSDLKEKINSLDKFTEIQNQGDKTSRPKKTEDDDKLLKLFKLDLKTSSLEESEEKELSVEKQVKKLSEAKKTDVKAFSPGKLDEKPLAEEPPLRKTYEKTTTENDTDNQISKEYKTVIDEKDIDEKESVSGKTLTSTQEGIILSGVKEKGEKSSSFDKKEIHSLNDTLSLSQAQIVVEKIGDRTLDAIPPDEHIINEKEIYEDGESLSEDSQVEKTTRTIKTCDDKVNKSMETHSLPKFTNESEDMLVREQDAKLEKSQETSHDTVKQHEIRKRSICNNEKSRTDQELVDKFSSLSTVDSGITDRDRDSITHTLLHGSSSEDVSKEVSLEEKYSFESTEKGDKKSGKKSKVPFDDSSCYTHSNQSASSHQLDQEMLTGEDLSFTSTLKELEINKSLPCNETKRTKTFVTDVESPKDEVPLSEASDSGVHSIPVDTDYAVSSIDDRSVSETMKDSAVYLMESIHKAFGDEAVQQGITTEGVESLVVRTEFDRVSTPPTVPVSPLPKTPGSFQDVKISEGVQSEVTYDKSDGSEETITKIVHVGEDVLTQKISTSTEKVSKPAKTSVIDLDSDTDLTGLMQNMGKIKTETDTVTKIIKEGENVVTQTITTVTTKEIISRDDGTPQNVKTTIETTTLSKGSDGSTNSTTDTQTLLSECSSSLRSTSQMDMYAKDSKIDKSYLETSDNKSEFISSQTRDDRESSLVSKDVSRTESKSTFISETDESDDNVEDTIIDTDVSKRIIRENNIDIIETVTTTTKKETIKIDESKKLIRTTVETNTTKEHPDGSKDVQKNVEVKTEELTVDTSSNLDKILSEFTVYGEPEESVTTTTEEVKQESFNIKRAIVTRIVKTKYTDSCGKPKKIKTETTVTTTDNYPDGSSRTKVDNSTLLSDIETDDALETSELLEFTIVEDKSVEVDKYEKHTLINGKSVLQVVTTTTVTEILSTKDKSQRKLKTTVETITETMLPDGVIEVTKDVNVSISDHCVDGDKEDLKGFVLECEPKEETITKNEIVTENGVTIKRKTTVSTIVQEFCNVSKGNKRTKTTVKTITENEHPDGSIITKTSEQVSLVDEKLKQIERSFKKEISPKEESKPFNGYQQDDTTTESNKVEDILKQLTPNGDPESSETSETVEIEENGILITRTILTRVVKIKYSDDLGQLKKIKTVTTVTSTDRYPDGSSRTTVDTSTSVSDIEIENVESQNLKDYTRLENKTINVDTQEKVTTRDGKEVKQIITTTTTKEILSSSDGSKKKIKTTIEKVTETNLTSGITEVTKDVKVSVADYGVDAFDENLVGFIEVGDADEHTTSDTESITENGITIIRKTNVTTIRQEFENDLLKSKKIKTTVKTVIEDEHPDGTVITKKSERVSITDVFLQTPPPKQDEEIEASELYIDDTETVEDTTEESDVKNEVVQQGSIIVKRTITTKTKRETLGSSDKNIRRVRTTVETTTMDEYPDGSTETTKDVKITISEFQKTSDSDLQAALLGLQSTGKIKTSVDKKTNIMTGHGEKVTQTITTYVTKEELLNNETKEIAVKTVTETLTENAKDDGSIETTKDVRTQVTYLPLGTGLDDWSPEELEEIEKQPIAQEQMPNLPLKPEQVPKPEAQPKKQRSPVGEITTDTDTFIKLVKEGDNEITQTITVVTTKEVISPEKLKVTVETTTVSKGSDGVTKTTKSTKTTISEYKEEYEETIDTGESEKSFSKHSSRTGDMRSSSAASIDMDHPGISTPPSDISSRGSRAATHVWGTESSGMYYSDDDGQGSPSSTKSQIAHSPRSNLSFELDSSKLPQQREGSHEMLFEKHDLDSLHKDPMSSSIYGQLPKDDSCTSSTHSEAKTEIHISDKSLTTMTEEFLTHEKVKSEHLKQSTKSSDATFLKEADEHFEKAIEEHKKVSGSEVISNITAKYELDHQTHSSLSHEKSSKDENTITLKDLKTESKKVTETSSSSSGSKQDSKSEKSEHTSSSKTSVTKDPIESWGKPLGLPSPIAPPTQSDGKSTPKKQAPSSTVLNKNKINQEKSKEAKSRVSESPSKKKAAAPVYLELTYVPHHGNSYYSAVEFFKRVRARYYVFSGTEPSKEIYNALLDAKKTWEDKDLEVTIIPTYDTDVLGYWVTENEEALEKYKIDLSPSASRCTINLQDHETSCAAYRLEF